MASRPWDDSERAILKELAQELNWSTQAAVRLPNRSNTAIRVAMTCVRRELGIKAERGRPAHEGWMTDAINGAARLLEALERTGQRP